MKKIFFYNEEFQTIIGPGNLLHLRGVLIYENLNWMDNKFSNEFSDIASSLFYEKDMAMAYALDAIGPLDSFNDYQIYADAIELLS